MAPSGNEHLILRPERASIYSLLYFLLSNQNLSDCDFVDTNIKTEPQLGFSDRLLIVITIVYMKVALSTDGIYSKLSGAFEYALNFGSLNGGLFGLIWRILTGTIVYPQPTDANYRSLRSFLSRQADLDDKIAAMIKYVPLDDLERAFHDIPVLELAMTASLLSNENKARIEDKINNEWKMNFEKYFEGWNFFIKANSTHGFVFCDKAVDAQLIVVVFRGSQELHDMAVNLDISWINTKTMGNVHQGFMKALGLQNEDNFADGFPPEYTGEKQVAYYSITELLREMLRKHAGARIVVTGHSLGGALALMYASLLVYHGADEVLDKIESVMAFGHPRVGDGSFGDVMVSRLGERYQRLVYRFDIVTRIPFKLPLSTTYTHFGTYVDYDGWYKATRQKEMPNPNYFNLRYWPYMYWGAVVDFFLSIWKSERWEAVLGRFIMIIFPGGAFHNPMDYIYAARYANAA